MTPTRRRVLITGASGSIGQLLTRALTAEYELVLHARNAEEARAAAETTGRDASDYLRADIAELDDVVPLMDDVDAVVHLAGAAPPDSTWEQVLQANIIGTRNVLEAARRAGVRRVVLASSNHVMGMYDRLEQWPVTHETLPRPDSLYGVSKAFGETLGRFYHDEHGLDVICLRIGWATDDPLDAQEDLLRAMWLSPGDTVRVVRCAIEAEVRFGVYYAISANPNARWSTINTTLELGYRPQDSWEDLPGAQPEEVVEGGAPVSDDWPTP